MVKAVIIDRETGEELTITALREEYINLKRTGETEAGCFEDYLENITDGNGTCDWIKKSGDGVKPSGTTQICEICHQPSETYLLIVDGHKKVCWDCASEMAIQAKDENRKIEIEDPEYCEKCYPCSRCEDIYPESDMWNDATLGYLCDRCKKEISRGETFTN